MRKKLHNWLKHLKIKKYKYQFVPDVPDVLYRKTIYVVQNEGYAWQIIMLCPCGCNKNLHMNLMKDYKPYWTFKIDKRRRITLYPSIHRIVGCRSHFFIKKGKVVWA
jgi:hypothetical protein